MSNNSNAATIRGGYSFLCTCYLHPPARMGFNVDLQLRGHKEGLLLLKSMIKGKTHSTCAYIYIYQIVIYIYTYESDDANAKLNRMRVARPIL